MTLKNKRGKDTNKLNKGKTLQVSFTVSKNVTAQSGMKTFYVRVTTPTGAVLGNDGSFNYANRSLQCTMKKTVEYTGQASIARSSSSRHTAVLNCFSSIISDTLHVHMRIKNNC